MKIDAHTKIIFQFLSNNQNHTLLTSEIAEAVPCSTRTVERKTKALLKNGYISKTGKKYAILKELEQ